MGCVYGRMRFDFKIVTYPNQYEPPSLSFKTLLKSNIGLGKKNLNPEN